MNRTSNQPSLLDLIKQANDSTELAEVQAQQHERLQDELPAELRKDWALFVQRLGGVNRYCCINFNHNIITAEHPIKRLAVQAAYDYAILFELLPLDILERVHSGRWLPAHYRQLLIDHERRTKPYGQAQTKTRSAIKPLHA